MPTHPTFRLPGGEHSATTSHRLLSPAMHRRFEGTLVCRTCLTRIFLCRLVFLLHHLLIRTIMPFRVGYLGEWFFYGTHGNKPWYLQHQAFSQHLIMSWPLLVRFTVCAPSSIVWIGLPSCLDHAWHAVGFRFLTSLHTFSYSRRLVTSTRRPPSCCQTLSLMPLGQPTPSPAAHPKTGRQIC